ncbi:MBL fold metallo-hydrolase [bacterium]|nr:MBL fold metallo-hydrolase [bacterium]
MKVTSLYSSSSGNSCRVFNDDTSILIDCGVSAKKLFAEEEFPIDALFITHEHADHIAGAGVIGRKVGMPIYIHKDSYEPFKEKTFKKCDDIIKDIKGGDRIEIGDFSIKAFTTRHDSRNGGLGYVVTETSTGKKFGYLTDTGSITGMMANELEGCDAYLLEADYDTKSLFEFDMYDQLLKERIDSPFGHLSNDQIMDFIDSHLKKSFSKVQWILFGHLSHRTNSPEMVKTAFNTRFSEFKNIYIAPHETLEIL